MPVRLRPKDNALSWSRVFPGWFKLVGQAQKRLQPEKWEPVFGSSCEATKKEISRDKTHVCQVQN